MKLKALLLFLLIATFNIFVYANDIVPSTQIKIVDVMSAKSQNTENLASGASDTLISVTNNTGGSLTFYGIFVAAAYTNTACTSTVIRNAANAAYSAYPPFTLANGSTTNIGGTSIYSAIYNDLANSGDTIGSYTSGVQTVKSIRVAEITSQISGGATGQTALCSNAQCIVPTVTNGTTLRQTSHTGNVCIPVTCNSNTVSGTPAQGSCNTGTTAGSNIALFL